MIVITTPAGQIGRQVLGNLLDSGEQLRIIARDRSALPGEVREDLDIVEESHTTRRLRTRHLPAPPFPGAVVTVPNARRAGRWEACGYMPRSWWPASSPPTKNSRWSERGR